MDALYFNNDKVTMFGFSELSEDGLIRVLLPDEMVVLAAVDNLPKEGAEGNWRYYDGIKDPGFKALLLDEFCNCQNCLVLFIEIAGVYYYYFNIVLGSEAATKVIERYERKGIDILRRDI